MATKNIFDFNLFDFFIYIMPGIIFLGIVQIFLHPYYSMPNFGVDSAILAVGIVLVAYVAGQFLNYFASELEKEVIGSYRPFQKNLIKAYEDQKQNESERPETIRQKFLAIGGEYYGIDIQWNERAKRDAALSDLYNASKADLLSSSKNSGRLTKFNALYDLFRSMTLVIVVYLVLLVIFFPIGHCITNAGTFNCQWTASDAIIFVSGIVISSTLAVYSFKIGRVFYKSHVNILVTETYTNILRPFERD
jgi:hypothetical protein